MQVHTVNNSKLKVLSSKLWFLSFTKTIIVWILVSAGMGCDEVLGSSIKQQSNKHREDRLKAWGDGYLTNHNSDMAAAIAIWMDFEDMQDNRE